MAIVTTGEELKKFISVDGSFDYKTILPYIEMAEDDMKSILGKEQYDELNDYYNGVNSGITELDELLPYAQRPVVYFAFLKGLDKINVSIGNNGIGIIHNNNLAPASKDRVDKLRQNIQDSAFDSLEYLLQFLEENAIDYPQWEASEAYSEKFEYLITSARQFDKLYKIKRSRLTFLNWGPTMADVEKLQIAPIIGKEVIDELKAQIKAGSITTENQKILPDLQKALAYLTAGIKENPAIKETGVSYLMATKKTMDENPDDYPTYKASSVYIADRTNYQPYENDENMNIAVFGM